MKRVILLSNVNDVKEFVSKAKELESPVLVSKEGFAVQLDGASIMGMMSLIGSKIVVDYEKESESFNQILNRKQVV